MTPGEWTLPDGLVDRLLVTTDDRSITALKGLSFREDYLRDHFPGYPLMPGALQLEVMFQAAAWLLRRREGFPPVDFLPRTVCNARYARHVRPGDMLRLTVTFLGQDGETYQFKGAGEVAAGRTVVAQFELCRYGATWKQLPAGIVAARIDALRLEAARLERGALPPYAGVSTSRQAVVTP